MYAVHGGHAERFVSRANKTYIMLHKQCGHTRALEHARTQPHATRPDGLCRTSEQQAPRPSVPKNGTVRADKTVGRGKMVRRVEIWATALLSSPYEGVTKNRTGRRGSYRTGVR